MSRLTIRASAQQLIDSVNAQAREVEGRFYTARTADDLVQTLLADGCGHSQALHLVYDVKEFESWKQEAIFLRSLNYSYEKIALIIRLKWGQSNYSQVVRCCDPVQAELHRARDKEYQARKRAKKTTSKPPTCQTG